MFFRMYQEKLQDFKQQLQHLNSGNNEYIVNFFSLLFMSLALIKKIEFQSTVFAMRLNISIQFADFHFVLCQVNTLNIARG